MLNPIFSIGHLREMSEYLRFSIASLLRPSAFKLQYQYSIMSLVKFALFKVIQFAATLICYINSYRVPLQAESKTDPKRYAVLLLLIVPLYGLNVLRRIQIEILSWMTRTALELIGQSGFGYSFDDFTEDSTRSVYAVSIKQYM